jgi:hypothetical protein
MGPGTLAREVVARMRVASEVALVVRETFEATAAGPDGASRFVLTALRTDGVRVLGQGDAPGGPFRTLSPPETLLALPARVGTSWESGGRRSRARVTGFRTVATAAGTFPRAVVVEETLDSSDPLDARTTHLTYESAYAPGIGLVSRRLKRPAGADRPVLDLMAYQPGASVASAPAATGSTGPALATTDALPEAALVAAVPPPASVPPPAPASPPAPVPSVASPAAADEAGAEGAAAAEVAELERRLLEKGESHYQNAADHMARRFPIEARIEIESALSFDPAKREYLDLKKQILASLVVQAPYRPAHFKLGLSEAEVLRTLGGPDRIEPETAEIVAGPRRIRYDRVFTYRGSPYGPVPAASEVEGPAGPGDPDG